MADGYFDRQLKRIESDTKRICKALSDIRNCASFDTCRKSIDELSISEMTKYIRSFTLIVIRCIAEEYASAAVFEKITEYFILQGFGNIFFIENGVSYMLYTFFSAEKFSESRKKSVIDSYYFDRIFSQRDFIYFTLLFTEAGDKRFLDNVMRNPYSGQAEAMAASAFYCAVNRKWDILEFILDNYKLSADVFLLIAVNYSELFSGEITERFSDKLPSAFRRSDGSVKSVEEMIRFLFRSKEYRKNIAYMERNANDLDVLMHIIDLLGDDGFDSIKNYIPEIKTVSITGISGLMESSEMLSVFRHDKSGILINAYYTSVTRGSGDNNKLLKMFLEKMQSVGCEVYVDPNVWLDVDFFYMSADDEYELLDVLRKNGVKVKSENEEQSLLVLHFFLEKDDVRFTQALIDIWQEILTDEHLFGKAVEYLVDNRKYNSLEVLHQRKASDGG